MFKYFRFFLLAIILPCMIFVSCDKEEGEEPFDKEEDVEEPFDVTVDFQNVTFSGEEKYKNDSGTAGEFIEGIVSFQNGKPEGYWYGFAYSQMHDVTTFDYATNEFSAYVPDDPQGNKFMVGYIGSWDAPSIEINFSKPVKDLSIDVANNTLAALAMKGEDPNHYAREFEDGDLFTLTITVTSVDETETITFKLGDGVNITEKWNSIKFQSKNISKLEFSLESTDIGDWGMNTPSYFCIDNIKARTVK